MIHSSYDIKPATPSPIPSPQTTLNIAVDDSAPVPSSLCEKKQLLNHSQDFGPLRRKVIAVVGSILSTALVPLLVVSFLGMRLLQFIWHGHDYYKVTQLKLFIRLWMYAFFMYIAFYFGIGSVIAEHSTLFKHISILDVKSSFYFQMSGIFFLSFLSPGIIIPLIPPFPLNHIETALNVREGILEITDCLILWWLGGSMV